MSKKALTKKQRTELEQAIEDKRTVIRVASKPQYRDYILWHFKDNVTVDYFYVIRAYNSGRRVVGRNEKVVSDSKTFNKPDDITYINEQLQKTITRHTNYLNKIAYGQVAAQQAMHTM